ncbi:MAG: hypothetical protein KGD60_01265 [Candidatus Thorarchaeota archaeon]|nr:hypothetical protein [Candidatus Thorarchaeota archaeon]
MERQKEWFSSLELQVDQDIIARGFGLYLALERLFTNKYSDHILRGGEDRYLGYTSIKKRLKSRKLKLLEKMMSDHGIKED